MHILIATSSNYDAFHGQAIFTKNLAEGLTGLGHNVLVVAGSEKGHAYQAQFKGTNVTALSSVSLRLLNPNAVFAAFPTRAMKKVFTLFNPDIVHIQDHYPLSRSAVLIARKRGVKVIGTNHFMPENLAAYIPGISKIKPLYNWVMWGWMREVYNRLDAVVAPSGTGANLLRSRAVKPPITGISCGANISLFHEIPGVDRRGWRERYHLDPQQITFFFVGRVDKEKRLDVLIRATSMLDRPAIQVVIAGNGANVLRLKKMSQDLNLAAKIHFTGFIPDDDLPSLLNSIDIFVIPSEAELLSIATIQAMSCARPIIAADAVALPELVENNVNGLLFQPGNVADLARCMAYLADNPDKWAGMGLASRVRAQHHSINKIVTEYEKLYRSLLGRDIA